MYSPAKNGRANFSNYAQLNTSQVNELTAQEGLDTVDLRQQKFAVLTYQVNPIEISGGVSIDYVKLHDSSGNEVYVSLDNKMYVIDQSVVDEIQNLTDQVIALSATILNANDTYSRVIKEVSGFTYMMHAEPGTASGETVWRIQRIDEDGSRMWPSGNNSFSYAASSYLTINYTL